LPELTAAVDDAAAAAGGAVAACTGATLEDCVTAVSLTGAEAVTAAVLVVGTSSTFTGRSFSNVTSHISRNHLPFARIDLAYNSPCNSPVSGTYVSFTVIGIQRASMYSTPR